ncbi:MULTISPECIES: DUF397 domain-containing protein [unclassified Nocardia]|uniref:DUF397 domain-containing protein n=1 Tax=unclassified Nocardia TaxID=2637762 RepID=UPI0024A82ADE|nr:MULTISPECIES: DUF397 domain-containing protein [unclassified Nocardia]
MDIDLSGAHWFTSSHSQGGGECVEVAFLDDGVVGVRDSKNPTGPALIFTASEWSAFTTRVSTGEFHRPN